MPEKTPLGVLPVASTSKTSDVDLEMKGGLLTLRFTFKRDGVTYRAGVQFQGVGAHRWRTEAYCTVWHIEGAYDTIAEVNDSEWVAELRSAEPEQLRGRFAFVMRHFMLYVDSDGCFEVVGKSWSFLPEVAVEG